MTLAGQAVSALELVAFVSGVLSVWLAQRLHIANWPASIVSVVCLAFVFFEAKLYADSVLQLAFVAVAIYGWWNWDRARRSDERLPVVRMSAGEAVAAMAAGAAGTCAVAYLLSTRTDSPAPWPDAAILMFSLVASWAQARRRIECWLVWIAVDLVAVPLYWSRALPLTTGLYLLFMLMCIFGWLRWERRLAPR